MVDQDPSRRTFLSQFAIGVAGTLLGGIGVGNAMNYWATSQNNSPDVPLQGLQIAPATLTTASGINIHHIQTGWVAVKQAHRAYDGLDGTGILAIAMDKSWTEWLPISTWAIEHPEGVIVIDTGETARANQPNYYQTGDDVFYKSFLRFAVTPEDEIGSQLQGLGIPPQEVRWVIQTHLHGDHMGGMRSFPNAEFIISPLDYPRSTGALPYHYPDWLAPTLVDFSGESLIGFDGSYAVTQLGDVLVVPTRGHSNGHQSVILRDGDLSFFFAGDTTFDDEQLRQITTAGIVADVQTSRHTLDRIQSYVQSTPTIYLPSHDHNTRLRLLNQTTMTF
ncbi:MAG: N-acyl homoserine lactonase family protein [Phototrophicaceae bacterium]